MPGKPVSAIKRTGRPSIRMSRNKQLESGSIAGVGGFKEGKDDFSGVVVDREVGQFQEVGSDDGVGVPGELRIFGQITARGLIEESIRNILLFPQRKDSEEKRGSALRPSPQRKLRRIVAPFSLLSNLNREDNHAKRTAANFARAANERQFLAISPYRHWSVRFGTSGGLSLGITTIRYLTKMSSGSNGFFDKYLHAVFDTQFSCSKKAARRTMCPKSINWFPGF